MGPTHNVQCEWTENVGLHQNSDREPGTGRGKPVEEVARPCASVTDLMDQPSRMSRSTAPPAYRACDPASTPQRTKKWWWLEPGRWGAAVLHDLYVRVKR